jgi:molybdopterin-containing oxidoreductase family membrane subunit
MLMGIFVYVDDVLEAIGRLKAKGVTIDTVYSPTRNHEITDALEVKRSPVRYFTLAGGILGVASGFGLAVYTAWQWKFIVSGKPVIPVVPYVIPGFEFCILIGVLFNILGLILNTRLPKFRVPEHYRPELSEDRFGVLVRCPADRRGLVTELLHDAGAEAVHESAR